MEKILFINACVRPNSRTLELAKTVLDCLDGEITELCLEKEDIKPLNAETLSRRDQLLKNGEINDEMFSYARQFAEADTIVIAAPFWDLLFPATVRIYLEAVTVSGLTFYYTAEGLPASLCRAKRLIYVTTAGGSVFGNMGYEYIKAVAGGFFGIKDCRCFKSEGLDIVGADIENIMENTKEDIRRYYKNRAQK